MELTFFQGNSRAFFCVICLNRLMEPGTLPCGHHRRVCVHCTCNQQVQSSCPQCRQSFSPRPELVTNTTMTALVEQLRSTQLQYNTMDLETWRQQIIRSIQVREAEQQRLQQDVLTLKRRADEVVKNSEDRFRSFVRELESVHSDVARQIKALQEREEAQIKQSYDRLQQEITELKRTFCETAPETLQHYSPPSAHIQRTYSLPLGILGQVESAVTKVTDLLQFTLKEEIQNISHGFTSKQHSPAQPQPGLSQPEPKTREDFMNYAREIILDPNTAHQQLTLSRGNRQASKSLFNVIFQYLDHPERFSKYPQVLSRDSLTGRCYWEVECENFRVVLAVSYKNIERKDSEGSGFGYNNKSWALECRNFDLSFWHQSVASCLVSGRIGVYLDHSAGVLAFYNIQDQTMSLLHRIQTSFTQPLYAGVRLERSMDTAYFPKLR